MSFKRFFGESEAPASAREYTVEDLIVLERYGEAEERLKHKLKGNPRDLHSHLKLADVYTASKQYDRAADEYVFVAEEYAQDGFFDKGLALLSRAAKLRPIDQTIALKIEAFERAKRLELSRTAALEGLRAGHQSDTQRQRFAIEVQQLWKQLAGSAFVRRLSSDQIRRFFSVVEIVKVGPGAILAERGSDLPQMALIARGLVEAVVSLPSRGETVLRSFGVGDWIGEGALLEHRRWAATYRAAEPSSLLTLNRQGVEAALMGNPNPREFLDALREQRNDNAVAIAVRQLGVS